MANPELLTILEQGAETWNKWRDENPHVYLDLSRAQLNEKRLSQAKLRGARLEGAELRYVSLD
jgi:uncharacterized protein YjbI with pentapeptide repeats